MTNEHNLPDKDDAPWLEVAGLSPQDIEDLRKSKKELTQYAKQKFKEKMTEPNPDINFELNENGEIAKIIINSSGSGWDEIFEKMNEYARNLPIPIPKKKLMNNNYIPDDDDVIEEMLQVKLTEEKKEELERMRRRENILVRFNNHYNLEMSSLPHGTTLTPEHMQAVTLECAISSLRCENMNVEYDMIAVEDIENLIEGLYRQSNEFLNRVKEQQEKTK